MRVNSCLLAFLLGFSCSLWAEEPALPEPAPAPRNERDRATLGNRSDVAKFVDSLLDPKAPVPEVPIAPPTPPPKDGAETGK